jgi:hypothetical protein
MKSQRHIGLIIFIICLVVGGKVALLEPGPDSHEDPLGFIHTIRYYIYGVGVLGLLIYLEDYINDKLVERKTKNDDSPSSE